jgi:pyridoxamine 5'-phosphate oxidase family protein
MPLPSTSLPGDAAAQLLTMAVRFLSAHSIVTWPETRHDRKTGDFLMFTEKERAYLGSQQLARMATIDRTGQPDADVISFELDGDEILIGSYRNLAGSRKYKNVAAGGEKVSLVVDSLGENGPMDLIAIKLHGTATIEQRDGRFGPAEYLVVRPHTSWSWGIEGPTFVNDEFQVHKTFWS